MQAYIVIRETDVSGVSGVGEVAQAIQFDSGQVVVGWLVPPHSLSIHDSLEAAVAVHGHNGATKFYPVALANKGLGYAG